MKRFLVAVAMLSLGIAVGCNDSTSPVEPGSEALRTNPLSKKSNDVNPDYDGYIVILNSSVSATDVDAIAADLGHKHKGTVNKKFKHALKGFSMNLSDSDVEQLKKDKRVKHVEPDYLIDIEPMGRSKTSGGSGGGKGGRNTSPTTEPTSPSTGGTIPWGISRVGGSHDGTGKTAWIIDTGIDFDHPDLNVDVARSRNFVSDGQTADDVYGHGTHVAGIVGALNNNVGVVGVAPNATLVSVRVMGNDGIGRYSWIIAGVDYVAANGHAGDVVNMSLGGAVSEALDDAVRNAASLGIRFAIAAGNYSIAATDFSPARVEHPNVYTVSACDQNDSFASFSNFGNPPIDFAAPGVNILSTVMGGGTGTKSGTSMAAPHVAGLLLVNSIRSNGLVRNDPDGQADPIAHY